MLDAIGEIIWALNPEHDQPDHLTSYLREFAANFLDSAGLRATLSFERAGTDATLSSEFRRNVFLVLKEALANVATHANAESVTVALQLDKGHLMLMVIDDGVGFTGTPGGAGHDGVSNMKRRARELGGSLTIQSAPGSGTRIRLDAPLPAGAGA